MIRILVPLDGSGLAEQALAHATAIAQSFKSEIYLLRVVGGPSLAGGVVAGSADLRMQTAEARNYLEDIRARGAERGLRINADVVSGRPAEEILNFTHSKKIDLIALTAYGKRGVTDFVQGSTVYKVVSRAPVSVLMVRPQEQGEAQVRYRRLLVPLDGSYQTDWALFLAASVARAHEAELQLLLVVQVPSAQRRMPASRPERELRQRLVEIQKSDAAHHLRELEAQLPSDVQRSGRVVVAEDASRVIEEMAKSEDIGLVVLSAHGLSMADRWLYGPVSETLLAHSTRPLLVLQDNLSSDKIQFVARAEPLAANG